MAQVGFQRTIQKHQRLRHIGIHFGNQLRPVDPTGTSLQGFPYPLPTPRRRLAALRQQEHGLLTKILDAAQ